jgi:hypothetical protein
MLTLRVCVTNARSARPNILGRSQTWSRCCIASELRSLSPVPVPIVPFRYTSATVFDTSRVLATRGILNADVNFTLAWTSPLPAPICSLSIGIRICAAQVIHRFARRQDFPCKWLVLDHHDAMQPVVCKRRAAKMYRLVGVGITLKHGFPRRIPCAV